MAEDITERRQGDERLRNLSSAIEHSPATVIVTNLAGEAVKEDIAERKRVESELQHAQTMEALGRLAAGIAHDFNNLLTIISGFGQLLAGRFGEEDPARLEVAEILNAAGRAEALTSQLLAIGCRQLATRRQVSIDQLVVEFSRLFRHLVGERVEIATDLRAGGRVEVDPGQFEQILVTLVARAGRLMSGGGVLKLATARHENAPSHLPDFASGPCISVSVSDEGPEIDPGALARVFEPFPPASAERNPSLGLSAAYGLVKQNGGHLSARSAPGGTTFTIYLPALPASEPVAEAKGVEGGNETVLVVEDEPGIRSMVRLILEHQGYRVLEAGDGAEALEKVGRYDQDIHLLLTGVRMPKMSGGALAEAIGALRPHIKVLFMSGYTGDAGPASDEAGEPPRFLQKPFTHAELLRKVRHALSRPPAAVSVLVVDDDPAVRRSLVGMLERAGYRLSEASNGRAALAVLAGSQVDVVLTDLIMPGQEGLELIREIRRLHPHIKVIAISGAFGGQFLRTAELMGADTSLRKPVRAETLCEAISRVTSPNVQK